MTTITKQLTASKSIHQLRNWIAISVKRSLIDIKELKEFHMLARIGCYCNIMVFSPFKVKVTYYHPLN